MQVKRVLISVLDPRRKKKRFYAYQARSYDGYSISYDVYSQAPTPHQARVYGTKTKNRRPEKRVRTHEEFVTLKYRQQFFDNRFGGLFG